MIPVVCRRWRWPNKEMAIKIPITFLHNLDVEELAAQMYFEEKQQLCIMNF